MARWPLYLGVILAIWLSFWLYAGTLSLPYLQEDVTHLQWLAERNPLDPFLSAEGAPAYRPLGKSIIKIWYLLLGQHDRAWLRFQNIGLNALNVALVALLGAWLDGSARRYWSGGLAALFFGALPFAYQAIPWINNFFYPLSLFLLLLMTAVYWRARLSRGPAANRLLLLALFLAFLAPFEIEYGVMGSGLLLAVEAALWLKGRQRQIWLGGPLLGLLMNGAFVLRWFTVPKAEYAFGLPTVERVLQIATYFLQGLAFPVAPLGVPLMESSGMSDLLAAAVVALPALLLLLGFLAWKGRHALLAVALLWFGLLNLPALLFVDFDYVLNGPRLLYPPGAAIAWLWGGAVAWWAFGPGRRRWRTVLGMAFVVVVLAISSLFVRRLLGYYHMVEQPVYELVDAAREAAPDDSLLVVNFPSWITPQERTFALGNHGMQLIPFYIGLDAVVYGHAEIARTIQTAQFANVRQPQPYYYGMLGRGVDYDELGVMMGQSDDVYLTRWSPEAVRLLWAGNVQPAVSAAPEAIFGDALALRLDGSQVEGAELSLTLDWTLHQRLTQEATVFVHLYGPDGALVDQADGFPLLGLAPFWLWEPGQRLLDHRTLSWPADAPPGTYRVGAGVYDPSSGQRLRATGAEGEPLPDDTATLLTITWPGS